MNLNKHLGDLIDQRSLNFFLLRNCWQKEDNQTIKNTVPENEHYLWIKEEDENTETWDLKRNLGKKIKKQNKTKPFIDCQESNVNHAIPKPIEIYIYIHMHTCFQEYKFGSLK